jgi:hypothetical protein
MTSFVNKCIFPSDWFQREGRLKAPVTRYDVNFAVALPDIAMGLDADGTRRGRIEIMLIAFSPDGNVLNIVRKRSNLTMDPKVYEATQQVGMQIHEEIDVPPAEIYLRDGRRSAERFLRETIQEVVCF